MNDLHKQRHLRTRHYSGCKKYLYTVFGPLSISDTFTVSVLSAEPFLGSSISMPDNSGVEETGIQLHRKAI